MTEVVGKLSIRDDRSTSRFSETAVPQPLPVESLPAAEPRGLVLLLLMLAAIGWGVSIVPVLRSDDLSIDEHVSYWIAAGENPGTLRQRSLEYAATPPLSSVLQCFALDLFGRRAWAPRLPSLVAMGFAPLLLFFAGRKLFGPLAGAIAAVLIAWHPDLLDAARVARPYGLSIALACGALLATAWWRERPDSWGRLVVWVAVQVALVWTHYVNIPFVALLTALVLGPWPDGGFVRALIGRRCLSIAALALFGSPLILSFLRVWELRPVLSFLQTAPSLARQVGMFALVLLPLGIVLRLLIGRSPVPANRTPAGQGRFAVLICLGLGLQGVFYGLSQWVAPTLGHQRYAVAGAAATVLLGAGLLESVAARFAVPATLCGLAGAWLLSGQVPWRSPVIDAREAHDWAILGRRIAAEGQPDEPIFTAGGLVEAGLVPALGNDPLFLDYVASRTGRFEIPEIHPRLGLPMLPQQLGQAFPFYEPVIRQAATDRKAIWLAAATDIDLGRDTSAALHQHLLRSGWRIDLELQETTARLERFQPPVSP